MDKISVPSIEHLSAHTKQCIDKFCSHTEVLNTLFRKESDKMPVAKYILKRITKEEINESYLDDLLAECILTMVSESTKRKQFDVGLNLPRAKRRISIYETFDKDFKRSLTDDLTKLDKAMMDHTKRLHTVTEGQQTYWKAHSSVTKYNLMVETAKSSRIALEDQLKPRELKSRDRSIKDLTKTLIKRQETESSVSMKYLDALSKEEYARNKMTELADDIRQKICSRLQLRLSEGISDLKAIITDFVSKDKHERLMLKINSIDMTATVKDLFKAGSGTYTFPVPREYHAKCGFETKLPQSNLTLAKESGDITVEIVQLENDQQCIRSNYFVQANSRINTSQPGFLKVKQGFRMKQKAYLNNEQIGFGWARSLPWTAKKWGFFDITKTCSV